MTRLRWLLAAAALVPLSGVATAQPSNQIGPGGIDLFCGLLIRVHGLEPVTRNELADRANYGDIVVVSLGMTNGDSLFWADQITRQGGAALIAADTGIDLSLWFPATAFARTTPGVTGWKLQWAAETDLTYADRQKAPFAVPLDPPRLPGPEWKIFRGLNRVATNQPSCLYLPPGNSRWVPIARFPKGCHWTAPGMVSVDPDPIQYPLATARTDRDQGSRTLVLADPSVFINEMMFPIDAPPTDNLKFASQAIDYLQTREDGSKRTRLALFVNGTLVTDFQVIDQYLTPPGPPLPPMPPIRKMLLAAQEKLVDGGNQLIDRLQRSDALNAMFRRGDTFRTLMRVLLLLAGVWAVWFVLRKVWGTRQPVDLPPAVPGGLPESSSGPVGLFDRRQRELLRRNNVYEPARDAVREMFAAAGALLDAGPKLPPIEITDAVRRPETLRKALTDLWKLAHGPPKVLTVQQWNVLEPLFLRARRAHADGKWQFAALTVSHE